MTLAKYLTILKLVYISLIASLAMFSLVSFFVFFSKEGSAVSTAGLPKYGILAVTFASLAGWTFTGKLLKTDRTIPLQQRLQSWYNYKVVRGVVLESVGMVGVVATVITNDPLYFLAPIFIAGILFTVLPSETRIRADLGLSADEMDELRQLNR